MKLLMLCSLYVAACASSTTPAVNGGASGGSTGTGGDGSANNTTQEGAQSQPTKYLSTANSGIAFEIDQVTGETPNSDALTDFEQQILALPIHKTAMTFNTDETLPANSHAYTFAELDALATAHQNQTPPAGSAGAYLLYVDGHFSEDTSEAQVLGFAYGGSRIVMFAETIKANCSQALPLTEAKVCELEEASVLTHEFGHLLGLVNNGTPMQTPHQDTAHGAHDSNDKCIMYWTVNSSASTQALIDQVTNGNQSIAPFDDNCLADLRAAAGP